MRLCLGIIRHPTINITEVQNGLRMLYKIRSFTKFSRTLIAVYRSLVELYFDYNCSLVWDNCIGVNAWRSITETPK